MGEGKGKYKDIPVQAVETLGMREVEAPTFSNIRLIDGGKVVSPMSGRFLPPGRFMVLISV
jgi:hypothetical protein